MHDPKNDDKTDYEVDAIAGATITGDGVSAMIKSDLKVYMFIISKLKKIIIWDFYQKKTQN